MDKLVRTLNGIVWGVLFITLPITSMPLVSRLVGGTMVAPPAMIISGVDHPVLFLALHSAGREICGSKYSPFIFLQYRFNISFSLSFFRDSLL